MESSSPRRSKRPSFHIDLNSDSDDDEEGLNHTSSNIAATNWIMTFCSESLYSFSYAYSLNDAFHSRLVLLKKSLQILKDNSSSAGTLKEALMATPRLSSSYLNLQASLFPEIRSLKPSMSSATLSFLNNISSYTSESADHQDTASLNESIDHLLELLDKAISSSSNSISTNEKTTDIHRSPGRTVSNPAKIMNNMPITLESERGRPLQKASQKSRETSPRTPNQSSSLGRRPIGDRTVSDRGVVGERRRTLTGLTNAQLQDRLLDALATPYVDFYMRNSRDSKRAPHSPVALKSGFSLAPLTPLTPSAPGSTQRSVSDDLHTSFVQQLNTSMSMLNLGALAAHTESASSNSDLPGFNITPLHPVSSKYSTKHALFTSSTCEPFSIYSCNDMACLMFGLSQREIKGKPIKSLIADVSKESFQEDLDANIHERQVLFCGQLFVVAKANGSESIMSFWAKTNSGGVMIWILEEVVCDITSVFVHADTGLIHKIVGDHSQLILSKSGSCNNSKRPSTSDAPLEDTVNEEDECGTDIDLHMSLHEILPNLKQHSRDYNPADNKEIDDECLKFIDTIRHLKINKYKYETLEIDPQFSFPCLVSIRQDPANEEANSKMNQIQLDIASLPHISGAVIIDRKTLKICDYNSSFLYTLLGYPRSHDLRGKEMSVIIPKFADILGIVVQQVENQYSKCPLGLVMPEYTFRKAARTHRVLSATNSTTNSPNQSVNSSRSASRATSRASSRDRYTTSSEPNSSSSFSNTYVDPHSPTNARHFDNLLDSTTIEAVTCEGTTVRIDFQLRVVTPQHYAVWITYCRHIHGPGLETPSQLALLDHALHRRVSLNRNMKKSTATKSKKLSANSETSSRSSTSGSNNSGESASTDIAPSEPSTPGLNAVNTTNQNENQEQTSEQPQKQAPKLPQSPFDQEVGALRKSKTLNDFVIVNKMGEGAYGKVLLVKSRLYPDATAVLKCVFKDRILVDTWTRDRKLGTIPNEIKIMATLNTTPHDNIIRLIDFFEDETFYHIEMERHGNPGSDLFDLIELKPDMTEQESKSIFRQTVSALCHLHKHGIVHRDIKDENVVVDENLKVKLIDFGSAAFCRQGPFDVFVGTVDYAAPEVLSGNTYEGKPQDVWAMGILLYTILYKENPFYNVEEIMDGDLRIPYELNNESVSLIKMILKRNVRERPSIFDIAEHPWLNTGSTGLV